MNGGEDDKRERDRRPDGGLEGDGLQDHQAAQRRAQGERM